MASSRPEIRPPRPGPHVQVFVAACTGSGRLSGEIGLPLVYVDASFDAEASIRRLGEREHGAGVRVPGIYQPIGFDAGWDDWALFPYAPGRWPSRATPRPDGVRAVEGRILVSLPSEASPAEFREQLHAGLRHLRLQDVTNSMAYKEARSDDLAEYVVQPRYTGNAIDGDFRRATLVTDVYVLDPAEVPWTLFLDRRRREGGGHRRGGVVMALISGWSRRRGPCLPEGSPYRPRQRRL